MYYANKAHGYKAETREWISQACYQLSQPVNKQALADLRTFFDDKKHCYTVHIDRTVSNFFNKQGSISTRSIDVTNYEKLIFDLIFTPTFYGSSSMECENLNIDDKYVTTLISRKKPGPKDNIKITIKIKDLPKPA